LYFRGKLMSRKNVSKKYSGKGRNSLKSRNYWGDSRLFKPTMIAAAIAVASMPVVTYSEGWGRNIELFVAPSSKNRSLIGGQVLQPLLQDGVSLTYFDLRGMFDISEVDELNFGLGHRRYINDTWLAGGYVSFDTRATDRVSRHNAVTFGLEALSERFDVNFNYYLPVSDPERVGFADGVFLGTTLFTNGIVEEALEGFDVEGGALLSFIPFGENRLYLGTYRFEGDVAPDTDMGFRARYELRPRKDINISAAVTHDDLFQTETMLTVSYSFGMPKETGVRTLSERMIQFHQRDIDVKETSQIPDGQMEAGGEFRRTISDDVVHIDSDLGTPGGDGSIEFPYDFFDTCQAGRCTGNPGALIYVHAGTGATYDSFDFTLEDGQSLFGQGFNLFGIGGDVFPLISNDGDVITLGNDNEVAGLEINDYFSAENGIVGKDITGFNIHHNRIIGVEKAGIKIETKADGISTMGTIANNLIDGNEKGVEMKIDVKGGGTVSQTISLLDNEIIDNEKEGVKVESKSKEASTATQTVTFSGNTIEGNEKGIDIKGEAKDSGSMSTQVITFTDNTISDNEKEGVKIDLSGDKGGVASQTVTFSGNTIEGDEKGIDIKSEAKDKAGGSMATQTISFSGDDISGDDVGIRIDNDSKDSGNESTQTVTFVNSSVSSGDKGIEMKNKADKSSESNQTVELSGTTVSAGGDAFNLKNEAKAGAEANQTLDLSAGGNTVDAGDDAVELSNKNDSGTANQTVDLTGGNTFIFGSDLVETTDTDATQTVIGP
jgi:hypothetical protein